MALLEIKNLSVEYRLRRAVVPALRNVSLELEAGETLGIGQEAPDGGGVCPDPHLDDARQRKGAPALPDLRLIHVCHLASSRMPRFRPGAFSPERTPSEPAARDPSRVNRRRRAQTPGAVVDK